MPSNDNQDDAPPMDSEITNAQMKSDSSAELQQANLQLEQIMIELSDLLTPMERQALAAVQSHWNDYRQALMAYARVEFGSGTNAPLAAASAAILETRRRASELRQEVERRSAL